MAQKVKNDRKIKSKSKVRIEGKIENKSCSTSWVDHKTVFEHYPNPKNSPLELQKLKNYRKIKSKSKVRIEGTIESWRVVQLHEKTTKQLLNPTLTQKLAILNAFVNQKLTNILLPTI